MDIERLTFLARLPLFLTSSMSPKRVIEITIERLREALKAEAVTVFLRDGKSEELVFWALQGAGKATLEGSRMPLKKGIVGWVIENVQGTLVEDTSKDDRFFKDVDKESKFHTRNMICVPLVVRGDEVLGAIQCLNRIDDGVFTQDDLEFLDQCAHQVSLAIHNALLYEKLQEENAKLTKLNQRKGEMISVISHEIKTPLTVIQGSAEILALNADEKTEKVHKALLRGVSRLTDLALEIRNVALVTGKKLAIEKEKIVCKSMFDEIEAFFRIPFKEREISFSTQLDSSHLGMLGDYGLIFLVLKNLVSNSIRFTDNKGTVTLGAASSKGLVTLFVTDTGIGIPEEEIPLLCERFYEVGSAMSHSSGDYGFKSAGLGLGLASVKAILESHGSTLRIQSVLGKGSTFSFALPESS